MQAFSRQPETARIAAQFLAAQSEILNPQLVNFFRTNMTEGLEEARSIAWQLAATPESAAGPELAARQLRP